MHPSDNAELQARGREHRTLLDVALQVGVRRRETCGLRPDEAVPRQLTLDSDTPAILERIGSLERDATSRDRATEHVDAESHTLFLREEGDLQRPGGRDAELVERAHDLDAAEHSEAPVEGAGGRDAVDVRADHYRGSSGIRALAACKDVAHTVDTHRETGILHPGDHQLASPCVVIRERLPIDARETRALIDVRTDSGELLQRGPEPRPVDLDHIRSLSHERRRAEDG